LTPENGPATIAARTPVSLKNRDSSRISRAFFSRGEDMSFSEGSISDERLPAFIQQETISTPSPFALQKHPLHLQPARVYIESLARGDSQRTMKSALCSLVQMMLPDQPVTQETLYVFPWEALRFEYTTILRTRLSERYQPATANKHIAALRGVLKAAWQLELMNAEAYHKAASIKNVRGSTLPAGRSLKEGELRSLLLTCQKDTTIKGCRDLALIALLFATGLRRQEVILLDAQDYDRETHALRVLGKGQKERLVYVEAPGAYEALHAWLALRGNHPGSLFVRIRRGGHLVSTIPGKNSASYKEGSEEERSPNQQQSGSVSQLKRLTTQGIYAILLERVEEADIFQLAPHDFRRNFISELLDNGVDLSIAQKLAGHASPTTTARYDRRPEATKKKAAGTLHVPMIRWHPAPNAE
jgi:site-specific recombinase XerD